MKRVIFLAFLCALPVGLSASTDRYIVVTKDPFEIAAPSLRTDDNFEPRAARAREFRVINGFAADLSDDQVAALRKSREVEWIEPVLERHVLLDAIVPGQQVTPWGVTAVNAPAVWPVTRGKSLSSGPPIHVAVIDTGIDYNSPELRGAYKGGHNFITGSDDPLDDFGHGTHVSGIIAAADDNQGVVGVAPGVDIYALKVLNQCGSGSTETTIQALDWILQKKNAIGGNWVVNLSLGSPTPSTAEQTAFQNAQSAGLLIFAAAGNSYDDPTSSSFQTDGLSFPAGYPSVISVGAVDSTLTVAAYSQRGPALSVVAPGGIEPDATHDGEVLSTTVDGQIILPDSTKSVARWSSAFDKNGNSICVDRTAVTAPFVYCGTGRPDEIPSSVAGKIALIERGGTDPNDPTGFLFSSKMKYAKAAGAIGVVVYNIPSRPMVNPALTGVTATTVLPFALITEQDGATLKNTSGSITIDFSHDRYSEIYLLESGTSMASPHAAAVAALAWAVAPNASNTAVATAVINSAKDLGAPGVDNVYGHGLVSAIDAAKQLNPAAFAPPQPTGRIPGRRGGH